LPVPHYAFHRKYDVKAVSSTRFKCCHYCVCIRMSALCGPRITLYAFI